jgi:hypothetical protein
MEVRSNIGIIPNILRNAYFNMCILLVYKQCKPNALFFTQFVQMGEAKPFPFEVQN